MQLELSFIKQTEQIKSVEVENLEYTKVVFRKFKDGDIIALFPELSEGGAGVESYMHIGQHSSADYGGCIAFTKAALPGEYKDLQAELESIGYNLLIRKRR